MAGDSIQFLIGKHIVGSLSPTGRATKGYVAFNLRTKRLCFLKDTWRPNSPDIPIELEVYRVLMTEGVLHVAKAIAGGDVRPLDPNGDPESQAAQCTVTQEYLSHGPLERLHSRLVLEELARPLETYETSTELVCALYDAIEGKCEYMPAVSAPIWCSCLI